MPKNNDHSCSSAIKKTLIYSSVFKYPLSFFQLSQFLITESIISRKPLRFSTFQKDLEELCKKGFVEEKHGRYLLKGTDYLNWKESEKRALKLIEKNHVPLGVLSAIPWVKFIGITGSIAAYSAEEDADLDIIIITAHKRIWITRGLFSILLKLIFRSYVKKGIDPNIFLDEANLAWPDSKHNIYIAHEILRLQPIVDKDYTYFKFIEANKWIFKYFSNFKVDCPPKFLKKAFKGGFVIDVVEKIAMILQLIYMSSKKTTEITKKDFIHFNKNDSTKWILELYADKLRGEGLLK